MSKQSWNSFILKNSNGKIFGAVVSSRLLATLIFDKAGKKLPTPYVLFQNWLSGVLTYHWPTTPVKGGLVLGIINLLDEVVILKQYLIRNVPQFEASWPTRTRIFGSAQRVWERTAGKSLGFTHEEPVFGIRSTAAEAGF